MSTDERTISRGEVWWVSVDDSVGSELQTGRPVLVLSSDTLNDKHGVYVVAFITTSAYSEPCRTNITVNGYKKKVVTNQLRTLDKSRFTRRDGVVSDADMKKVVTTLAQTLCMHPSVYSCVAKPEPEEPEEELNELRMEVAELRMQLEMHKRMYDKTMDMLVDTRIERDLLIARGTAVVEPPVEPEQEQEQEQESDAGFELREVELNTCELADLLEIGINEDVAQRLIDGRPWKKVEDISGVDGMTSVMYAMSSKVITVEPVVEPEPEPVVRAVKEYTWEEFKNLNEKLQLLYLDYRRNTLGEKETEIAENFGVKAHTLYNYTNKHPKLLRNGPKPQTASKVKPAEVVIPEGAMVNINTATAKEISEQLGMPMKDAYCITGYRNKNGLFEDIEELILVPRFSKNKVELYRDHVCVVDKVEDDEPEEPKGSPVVKFNINTASAYELQQAGFTKTQAHKIVGSRKYNGPFYALEDLLEVDCIKKKDIRKLRDVLEV